jgi:hypothetical protein
LKVGCNMAQAFEIPKGVTGAHSGAFAAGSDVSHRKASSNAFFQIAAPGPTQGRIGTGNMGLPPDRRKRIDTALARPATGLIPGAAIRNRVIVSSGFDKGPRRPVVQLLLSMEGALGDRYAGATAVAPRSRASADKPDKSADKKNPAATAGLFSFRIRSRRISAPPA